MAKPYRIAVTGHRDLGDESTVQFVAKAFYDILAQAQREHSEGVVALCGLAEGADMLFAEAAIQLGLPVEAVIAYQGFLDDFPAGPARERYQTLLGQCQVVHLLSYRQRSDEAYLAVGIWLVDHSSLLVAAWNGESAAGKGGTGDVVAYAQKEGRPVQHIHTVEHTIRHSHPKKGGKVDKFEEYKLFVEDTARFTDRRHTLTNIYVAVNSIFLGAIALLSQGFDSAFLLKVCVLISIVIAGIFICLQWLWHIRSGRQLVKFRITQLRQMENHPEMTGCHRMYHAEDELYPRDNTGEPIPNERLNKSREPWLPRVFLTVYVIFLLGLVLVLILDPCLLRSSQ